MDMKRVPLTSVRFGAFQDKHWVNKLLPIPSTLRTEISRKDENFKIQFKIMFPWNLPFFTINILSFFHSAFFFAPASNRFCVYLCIICLGSANSNCFTKNNFRVSGLKPGSFYYFFSHKIVDSHSAICTWLSHRAEGTYHAAWWISKFRCVVQEGNPIPVCQIDLLFVSVILIWLTQK